MIWRDASLNYMERFWVVMQNILTFGQMELEFNEIVRFKLNDTVAWYIADPNSIYNREFHEAFQSSPKELSAELCALYFLREVAPDVEFSRYSKPPSITAEIEAWIEKYIVLPEPQVQIDG